MPLTDEELQELKDKNKALEDENCDLKEKLKAQEEEGDGEDEEKDKAQEEEDEDAEAEKEMNRRSRASVVKLKRENATIKRRLDIVKDELVVERYSRELDTMENEGYTFSDEQRSEVLSRIKAARDPDSELDFVKSLMHRHPVGLRIDQTHSRPAGASRKTIKSRKDAAQRAQDRCMKEGKPEMFTQYLAEEKAA